MTKEEINSQTLKAIEQIINGNYNNIQANSVDNKAWQEAGWVNIAKLNFKLTFHPRLDWYNYRIKPAPKMRLIKMDELPPVFWIRENKLEAWNLVTKIGGNVIITSDDRLTLDEDYNPGTYQWSPDRKQICSFFVEVL